MTCTCTSTCSEQVGRVTVTPADKLQVRGGLEAVAASGGSRPTCATVPRAQWHGLTRSTPRFLSVMCYNLTASPSASLSLPTGTIHRIVQGTVHCLCAAAVGPSFSAGRLGTRRDQAHIGRRRLPVQSALGGFLPGAHGLVSVVCRASLNAAYRVHQYVTMTPSLPRVTCAHHTRATASVTTDCHSSPFFAPQPRGRFLRTKPTSL